MLSDHVCARSTGRRAPCAAALAFRRRPAVPLALASLMVATLLCDLSPEAAGFVVCSSRSSTRSAAFSTSPLCGAASPVRHARRSRGHVTMELHCGASGDAPTEVGSHTRRRMLRWTAASGISCGLCELMFPPATAKAAVAADDDEEEEGADPAAAERASDSRQVALPKLASRFAKGQVKSLGPAGPLGPPDAAAPAWLEGTWQVEYTFERASFPLTKDFAQFKQLLAGSVRTPGDAPGVTTETTQVWRQRNSQTPGAVDLFEEDKASNLMAYYNAFSKDLTIETPKGPRTRKVAWMPILTQRGIYEKINEVQALGSNSYRMIAKEIAPDLSVVGTAPVEIAVCTCMCVCVCVRIPIYIYTYIYTHAGGESQERDVC
jgi:hypothetical protein